VATGRSLVSHALRAHLREIAATVRNAKGVFLLLDFDGTLSPIVTDPDAAQLPAKTRNILRKLSGLPSVSTIVISGRALSDVTARVGLDLIYAGNHGLEVSGRGLEFQHPRAAALRPVLKRICTRLVSAARDIGGAAVENKGLTASVHFRQVAARDRATLGESVRAALGPHGADFIVRREKEILSIRPRVRWHKGSAARWIRRRLRQQASIPICIGDDVTDEDLFTAFPDVISIHVGSSGPTGARFSLRNTTEVQTLLLWLFEVLAARR
jgi:trehalose-phosphatase